MLRVAGRPDLEVLHRFEVLCFPDHPFSREHIAWILENEHAVTLVEDRAGALDAATMLLFEGRVCRVLSVGVAPSIRRQGIARRLMGIAEAVARERGSSSIRLEVSTRNLPAIELYRRLGYRMDGVLYGYYSWGEDAYGMEKRLPVTVASKVRARGMDGRIQPNKY